MTKSAVDSVAVLALALAERKRENERLRDRLARMTAIARERGEALNFADDHLPAWHALSDERDHLRTKVAAVEALRDEWAGTLSDEEDVLSWCARQLHTALSEGHVHEWLAPQYVGDPEQECACGAVGSDAKP